jgi:argininosuccinate synthase
MGHLKEKEGEIKYLDEDGIESPQKGKKSYSISKNLKINISNISLYFLLIQNKWLGINNNAFW